jgi:hypothetical protein
MKKNIGNVDRMIRVLVAIAVAALYFANVISGTLALVLGLIGVIFLFTSAMGFCPIYFVLRLSSAKKAAQ